MPDETSAPALIPHIYRVRLSRERLKALSPEERAFFLPLTYAANQIAMFSKLVILSTNETPENVVEAKLSSAQSQMLARQLIGILAETWETVRGRFLAQPALKEYVDLLDASGKAALEDLKRRFGGSSLLTKLRNGFAFHHPKPESVEAAFAHAIDDENWADDWDIFIGQSLLNTFYFASDVVILHGMLAATGENDPVKAHTKIMEEVRRVSDSMMEFIHAFSAALWKQRFGAEMTGEICANIEHAPDVLGLWIPFFVRLDPATAPQGGSEEG